MNKKGISPFIATVLLIGAVVILSVVVVQFMKGFSEERTESVERQADINYGCGKSPLVFEDACYAEPNLILFKIKNEGSYGVRKIDLTYFLSDGSTQIGELAKYDTEDPFPMLMLLGKFGFVNIEDEVDFDVSDLEKIKYVKTIDLEDGTEGKCTAIEFNVDSIETC